MKRCDLAAVLALVLLCNTEVAFADPGSMWVDFVQPWFTSGVKTVRSPMQCIKDLDKKLSGYHTGANLAAPQLEENRQIKQEVIHGTFDLRELSRIGLGRHWISLSDAQRNDFVQLMTDLLEEKAVLSKEQGRQKTKGGDVYAVTYRAEKFLDAIKSRSLVRTQVFIPSKNIRVGLDYKLRRKSMQWKIYDVIVDGSSLVENYQYQFDKIITNHGYQELVNRMQKKLGEIRAEKNK